MIDKFSFHLPKLIIPETFDFEFISDFGRLKSN